MKKLILAAAIASFAVPAAAAPGDTANATGDASATILSPITLTHVAGASLNFGQVIPGTAAGTVTVTTGGTATAGGDATVTGTDATADSFTVGGEASRTFAITASSSTVSNGTDSMSFTPNLDAATGTLDGSGAASFSVGGVLSVGANQADGVYSGTYAVEVSYN